MLIIIFVCAFIIRFAYLLQSKSADPLFYQPIMDALYHHEWAVTIAKGDWLGSDAFFRAPFYPYFLAFLYKITGVNLFVVRIVQIIIGSVNCVLTAKLGTYLFKRKVGIAAGFVACAYPLFIYFNTELLIPTLLIFLTLLAFYVTIKQSRKRALKWGWFATGVFWAVSGITRPNIFLFLFVLPIWLWKKLKKIWKTALLFGVLGVAAIVLPVTVRNYVVSKEFVLIAWQGGTNFYIGNNPHSDGFTAIIPGTRKTWWGGFHDAKRIAEKNQGRQLKNSEINRYWFNQGFHFIRESPLEASYLFLKKSYLFFAGYEISNNRDIYFFTRLTFLKFLIINVPFFQFPFGVLLPFALVGIFVFIRQQKSSQYDQAKKMNVMLVLVYVVTYAFSFVVFFVCARYRLPIVPFLIIFACSAIFYFIHRFKKKKYRQLLIPTVLFVGSYIICNANIFDVKQINPGINHCTLGVAYKGMGNMEKAVECYKKSIETDPMHAEGYYNLGNIYAQNRHFKVAKDLYVKAITVDPYAARAYNNLGNIYFETGKFDSALVYYATAIKLEPDYETPFCHSGLVYKELGEFAKAESVWQQLLKINPRNTRVRQLLQTLPQKK